jgi:hypothetical protein
MYQINQITSDTLQKHRLILPIGTALTMTLCFKPMQYGWFIEELVYGSRTYRSIRICVSPNFLYQFKNVLPFGLACYSSANREATQKQDFSSKNCILYLLNETEVQQLSELISGQTQSQIFA